MRSRARLWNTLFLLAPFLPVVPGGAGDAAAQRATPPRNFLTTMRTGLGYAGVLPDVLLGAGAFHLPGSSRIGLFAEGKTKLGGLSGDDDYCPSGLGACDVSWVLENRNDEEIRTYDEWLVLNAGIVYAMTPEFALVLGGGAARETVLHEFVDETEEPSQRLTPTGRYYVDDAAGSGWTAQLVGGVIMRAGSSLAFRFGYETGPGGMSIGAYFVLP